MPSKNVVNHIPHSTYWIFDLQVEAENRDIGAKSPFTTTVAVLIRIMEAPGKTRAQAEATMHPLVSFPGVEVTQGAVNTNEGSTMPHRNAVRTGREISDGTGSINNRIAGVL